MCYRCLFMRFGFNRTQREPVPEKYREDAIAYLQQSFNHARKAVKVFKVMGSSSTSDLFDGLYECSDALDRLHCVSRVLVGLYYNYFCYNTVLSKSLKFVPCILCVIRVNIKY